MVKVARGPSHWTCLVLGVKGTTYLVCGWMITVWDQALQSLGTTTGAQLRWVQHHYHVFK